MRIAGGEDAVGDHVRGSLLQRCPQFCCRIVKSTTEKVGTADPREIPGHTITRVETLGCPEVFDRHIGLTGEQPEYPAPIPTPRKTRIKRETALHQAARHADVFIKSPEHVGGRSENIGVVVSGLKCSPSKIDSDTPLCLL